MTGISFWGELSF